MKGDEDYYVEESFSVITKMTDMVFQIIWEQGEAVRVGLWAWCVREEPSFLREQCAWPWSSLWLLQGLY